MRGAGETREAKQRQRDAKGKKSGVREGRAPYAQPPWDQCTFRVHRPGECSRASSMHLRMQPEPCYILINPFFFLRVTPQFPPPPLPLPVVALPSLCFSLSSHPSRVPWPRSTRYRVFLLRSPCSLLLSRPVSPRVPTRQSMYALLFLALPKGSSEPPFDASPPFTSPPLTCASISHQRPVAVDPLLPSRRSLFFFLSPAPPCPFLFATLRSSAALDSPSS